MIQYYKILELEPGASLEEVKRAYKRCVIRWHPDRFPEDDLDIQERAHKMFRLIREAYSKLQEFYQERSRINFADEQPDYITYYSNSDEFGEEWIETVHSEAVPFITREWPDGSKYEGMIQNQVFHGRGILTYCNGDIYKGEFRHGNMEGHGEMEFADGGRYIGEFIKNQKHGRGKLIFANGEHYIGQFAADQFHGEGILVTRKKVYAGLWHCGGLL